VLALLAWGTLVSDEGLYTPPDTASAVPMVVTGSLVLCVRVFHHRADKLLVMENGRRLPGVQNPVGRLPACIRKLCNRHDPGLRSGTNDQRLKQTFEDGIKDALIPSDVKRASKHP
jgi:hypothetical protein